MSQERFTFKELLGQEKAKSLLLRAIKQQRLGHAYLFRGPAGVGKKRAAATFAAALNCSQGGPEDACGMCPSCLKIASGNHPDFLTVAADGSSIKIQQIRELKKTLSFPPFEAAHRVVLLADIQLMGREAANSLLKTLEEPPAQTILILTVEEADDTLATIRSRCQIVPFYPLAEAQVTEILRDKAPEVDQETAKTIATLAEGSAGLALQLAGKRLIAFRRDLIGALSKLPPEQPETIRSVLQLAETAAAFKEELPRLLSFLSLWLRDLLLFNVGQPAKIINLDLVPLFEQTSKKWSPAQIMSRLDSIGKAERQLARNCNRGLVCEVLFFSLL
ncbi:MAG: DNA polymerase III subunit delta' [Deltaproteobacteria bacterium]